MKIRLFYHSLVSDWNHGNAHFLRGVVSELKARRHDVVVYEPADGWSLTNLVTEHGRAPLKRFRAAYPDLKSVRYDPKKFNAERAVAGADLVIVHEWNSPALIERIGEARRRSDFVLLFHDTHHRLVTERATMRACNFAHFDGVLAYGDVLRRLYLAERLVPRAWTWHEAADTRRFRPAETAAPAGDLVWVGNWGDNERAEELQEFLIQPVKKLGLKARVYGVRYPEHARTALADAGIEYAGWLPNFEVPEVFAQFKMTVHIPRLPYVKTLPGIPTIRPFEALACGIPLVCSPWRDAEHLFTPGKDFLVARDGGQMTRQLASLARDETRRRHLAERGLATIRQRHTCAHRVDELMAIHAQVVASATPSWCPQRNFSGDGRIRPERQPRQAEVCASSVFVMNQSLDIAFFGSSLVSAYWNGAATYYRGIVRALAERGHRVTFYEPDAYGRQQHRDMPDPDWARVVVYSAASPDHALAAVDQARGADLVIKASGVGVFDELLEAAVLELQGPGTWVAFWDVDAPATLDRVAQNPADPFRALIPHYDLVLTYGGGAPVVEAYKALGAQTCVPIYNALDPHTHFPVSPEPRFTADLAFLGNRLPDRERRVEEFFLNVAAHLPRQRFVLGGSGWEDKPRAPNVSYVGHVFTRDHNAFNCTPKAVLNINRDSMARYGFSPPTRVFEAAGAGACLITDAWVGIELFLEPVQEVLVAADGTAVAEHLAALTPQRAKEIGEAAFRRVLAEHTYARRSALLEEVLEGRATRAATGVGSP